MGDGGVRVDVGLMGLAVMGKNLALNIASKGFGVAVCNRDPERTRRMEAEHGPAKGAVRFAYSMGDFVGMLPKPRKVILMVKAGAAVDEAIARLRPLLDEGDLIVDAGNSRYQDTVRRIGELSAAGLKYLGTGVSGGEEGALLGPAIMPGGSLDAYGMVEPILTAISAKAGGEPCCAYMGDGGAGHFVKMVHNGIEYGDMQLIGEAYWLLKSIAGLGADRLQGVFGEWNKGELESYLIGITRDIFGAVDAPTGKPMVDVILDEAGQKGTGAWAAQEALELGVPAQTIAAAVASRSMSAMKGERMRASRLLKGPDAADAPAAPASAGAKEYAGRYYGFMESVRRALYAGKVISYSQGFSLMAAASERYRWGLDLGGVAAVFRGGCIIRAKLLQKIRDAYGQDPGLVNLMLDPYFSDILSRYQKDLRKVVVKAAQNGVPVPALSASLTYYDSYRGAESPANLIQAQRDYFGAHTFERRDDLGGGPFHHEWPRQEGAGS
ncbi:MAG: NADP-dependent phosphogluconate dehydrogenase [Oscillospiraceae bacterium]|nr:NADP-dependent phosphogluconate dehydrogenase [Oscillospiraceae bacterium]